MHPARVQASTRDVEQAANDVGVGEPDQVFNLWHRKWAGGDRTNSRKRSNWKCDPKRDSGATQAEEAQNFCLYFARGMCTKGSKCSYLHRVPDPLLDHLVPATDCFGREKHAEYRDDLAGVGSFLHENSTLRVGHFKNVASLEPRIRHEFSPWGEIASIRKGHSAYFVTYKDEISAQFAKEAMANQTITGKETLSITWAATDPQDKFKTEDRAMQFVKRALEDAGWHVNGMHVEPPQTSSKVQESHQNPSASAGDQFTPSESSDAILHQVSTPLTVKRSQTESNPPDRLASKKSRIVDYSDSD